MGRLGWGPGAMQGGVLSGPAGRGSGLTPSLRLPVPSSSLTRRANEEIMDSKRQIDDESKRMRQL